MGEAHPEQAAKLEDEGIINHPRHRKDGTLISFAFGGKRLRLSTLLALRPQDSPAAVDPLAKVRSRLRDQLPSAVQPVSAHPEVGPDIN